MQRCRLMFDNNFLWKIHDRYVGEKIYNKLLDVMNSKPKETESQHC